MTTFSAASTDNRNLAPIPVPAQPPARESIAGTWVREIAAAVAAALNTTFTNAGYRLTLHDRLPAPRHLQAEFGVAGHRIDIDVRWPDLWQAPQFALRVNDRDVTVEHNPQQRPAVAIAHAAWLAILDDCAPPAGYTTTARTEAR